jgi:hypothetical protein
MQQPEISALAWNKRVEWILATCSVNGTATVWDLKKQKPVITLRDTAGCALPYSSYRYLYCYLFYGLLGVLGTKEVASPVKAMDTYALAYTCLYSASSHQLSRMWDLLPCRLLRKTV